MEIEIISKESIGRYQKDDLTNCTPSFHRSEQLGQWL